MLRRLGWEAYHVMGKHLTASHLECLYGKEDSNGRNNSFNMDKRRTKQSDGIETKQNIQSRWMSASLYKARHPVKAALIVMVRPC